MNKDIISIPIDSQPKKVYEIITRLDKIRIWEPSHGFPLTAHAWLPVEGTLKTGHIIKVKTVPWTFVARCIELKENSVKWKFIKGPLKGTESWIIESTKSGCNIIKLLEYEVPNFLDGLVWHSLWRKIHNWASLKQLKTIKMMAENKVVVKRK